MTDPDDPSESYEVVFTREGLAIEADFSLPSLRVVRALVDLMQKRGQLRQ